MNKLSLVLPGLMAAAVASCATKSSSAGTVNRHEAVVALASPLPGTAVPAATTNTVINAEAELRDLMQKDDEAMDEVDKWIQENDAFAAQGAGVPAADLNQRIRKRLEPIKAGYVDFIARHPDNADARVAYASFLDNTHDDDAVLAQLEKARELAPTNPAVWNQLANLHGHTGDPKLAFDYYAKAIELDPNESVYYHNFGTTVYLFRKDAMEHYSINETQVFEKALELYAQAIKHDPTNFALASDVAQTYYGIKPLRTDEALKSWTNALSIANNEIEREGVYIHFARIKLLSGRFPEARAHLEAVTNTAYAELKARVAHSLEEHAKAAAETNSSATNSTAVPPP